MIKSRALVIWGGVVVDWDREKETLEVGGYVHCLDCAEGFRGLFDFYICKINNYCNIKWYTLNMCRCLYVISMSTIILHLRCGKENFIQMNTLQRGETQLKLKTESVPLRQGGRAPFMEKGPTLVPNWYIFYANEESKSAVLIGQRCAFWFVGIGAKEDIVVQFWYDSIGQVSVHW